MKTKTLQLLGILCLISVLSFGQTYTTGLFNMIGTGGEYDAQIDINLTSNPDLVTLTLIGPDSGWLAMGFDSFGHDNADVVMFDSATLSDREFTGGHVEPIVDGTQDWTITNNTTNGGLRTLVATRDRDTGDANDYVFSATPSTLDIVGSYNSSFDTGNRHDQRDFATVTFSLLGLEGENQINFSMSPNPASSRLKVALPSTMNNGSIDIYDMLSRKIFTTEMMNTHTSIIDVSSWNSGIYLVKVSNGSSSQTKRFVKQ